jgi:hypothetical protein
MRRDVSSHSHHASGDDDRVYEDHFPIMLAIENSRREESCWQNFLSLCCSACWRREHKRLVSQLNDNDEDWGLDKNETGSLQLSPKHVRELRATTNSSTGREPDFSVSVTDDDNDDEEEENNNDSNKINYNNSNGDGNRANQQRRNRNGSHNSNSRSGTTTTRSTTELYHDTDILLAVTEHCAPLDANDGDNDDEDDAAVVFSLSKTQRPFLVTSSASLSSRNRQQPAPQPLGDSVQLTSSIANSIDLEARTTTAVDTDFLDDDYMQSLHGSVHGMSQVFRGDSSAQDALEQEIDLQLKLNSGI